MRRVFWAICALLIAGPAFAQAYPSRPITIVVAYAPGGTTDVLARIMAKAMTAQLGQSVIVENVGGAGGTTGTQRVVRAEPDGYTLTIGNMGSFAANVSLYPNLSFDPRKDLAPIGLIATIPMVVSASKKSGITDMAGFLKRLREKEGSVNIGTAGIGSTSHLAAVAFQHVTKTKATLVNYRGSGPSITDLVAGVVDVVFDQTVTMIPMHKGGSVTAFGVSSKARIAQLPDVPTFIEGGVSEFDLSVWNAMMAPKGTPPEIVAKLEAALSASLDDPEVKQRFSDLAAPAPEAAERGAAHLGKLVARDVDRLGDIVRAAGVKVE
ncbi:Bug family tripartite tricarboxylate transporter substrate binding protein [Enterovirga rhinocerotis]|uniref:Tripartite-type tricarboxylate transporter receptor subunit TctC n=1 Tax=Enterovirga rhinocerotis TaxID=1339210 RepID=A0A4R7BXQ4_9HYPH|nr:tripartite tricarboxylate transporter substrate binding protein [Enterovirga rhinocerotis]TDR90371.1 tripartite-type tricarboxylate transporter receptor subunit TctC [Enterovirga rhinocerotis]